jgi:hypothetical protein
MRDLLAEVCKVSFTGINKTADCSQRFLPLCDRPSSTPQNAIAPAFTTLAPAIALRLPTYRVIAPLQQNLGQGDLFSAARSGSLYASKISNNAIVFTFVVLSIQKHDLNLIL